MLNNVVSLLNLSYAISLPPNSKFYWNTKPSGLKIWPRKASSLLQPGFFVPVVRQSIYTVLLLKATVNGLLSTKRPINSPPGWPLYAPSTVKTSMYKTEVYTIACSKNYLKIFVINEIWERFYGLKSKNEPSFRLPNCLWKHTLSPVDCVYKSLTRNRFHIGWLKWSIPPTDHPFSYRNERYWNSAVIIMTTKYLEKSLHSLNGNHLSQSLIDYRFVRSNGGCVW